MPKKPRRGCAYPGCPKLAEEGKQYCKQHKCLTDQQYDRWERTDHAKRYGGEWQQIRNRYVKVHPLCEMCLKEGVVTPVKEVHHIKPLSQGGTNDESNLMSLCQSCHMKIHMGIGDRKGRNVLAKRSLIKSCIAKTRKISCGACNSQIDRNA